MIRRFLVAIESSEEESASDSEETSLFYEANVCEIDEDECLQGGFEDFAFVVSSSKDSIGSAFEEAVLASLFQKE